MVFKTENKYEINNRGDPKLMPHNDSSHFTGAVVSKIESMLYTTAPVKFKTDTIVDIGVHPFFNSATHNEGKGRGYFPEYNNHTRHNKIFK